MNLRDLEYFVLVAELKHFGKAAEKAFVSQPTLSMQLKKLEEYLGVALFERTNRQVHLTTAGELLYKQAKSIVSEAKNLQEAAKSYRDPYESTIKLGVIPTIAPYYLPHLLPTLNKHFPKLKLEISELKTEEIIKFLREHEIDIGLLALPVHDENFATEVLFEEEFLLMLAKDFVDYPVKKISDLRAENLLLLEEGHCLRDQALEFCNKQTQIQLADLRATSLETLRALVRNKMGYTLMPKMAAVATPGIVYQQLKPSPNRTVGFIYRNASPQAKLFKEVSEKLRAAEF